MWCIQSLKMVKELRGMSELSPNLSMWMNYLRVMLSIKDKDALSNSQNLLKEMSPPPMNVMLQKQTRSEVLLKHVRRKCIVVNDVPPQFQQLPVCHSAVSQMWQFQKKKVSQNV
ncbi:uncharacterized protein LOC124435584 [Xenia sp. Carnegie-2017]|uniref:uncharacterized protein LOC124435584 n=1 Tax=Xenia sp. Carnegie-2017 TaxID=2897299 RepID=UPI001F038129|nr:uncharacterized protein LOC124435584 [Xenia sp. Carnegie-2017]